MVSHTPAKRARSSGPFDGLRLLPWQHGGAGEGPFHLRGGRAIDRNVPRKFAVRF
jgi:hypothetical protein